MRNSFEGAQSHPPATFSPGPDESGPRLVPQRQPDQDQTRQIDEAALKYINRRRDAQIEPTPIQDTTTYSAERLNERLDLYRARHTRGSVDEIKGAYASGQGVEPKSTTEAMGGPSASAAAYRREHERATRVREEQAALAAQREVEEAHRAIEAARPPINPNFNEKLNGIIERRFGKEAASFNRPRLVVTGAPPAPLHLARLMERAHEEPTEIEDLTAFAEEVEPEIEQTPIERRTNTVILARNKNVPSSMRAG